jgi:predicted TIM-barrel fold metal-dependent hydrolase
MTATRERTAATSERVLPKIVSVDDHVVEPPHVWQTWLPEQHRARGPRVERKKWGEITHLPGARYEMSEDPDGIWGDAWYLDGRQIYVHKRFVAIPLEATPGGDLTKFDRTKMVMTPVTYDEMRPGCYDRDARMVDFENNWTDGSLPFPTFPRFCGQTFYELEDRELGLACVQAYNDWMVEEWCAPSKGINIPLCIMPLWDVELAAAEIRRNAERGVRAFCFSELPHHLKLPTIHSGGWDPVLQMCNDTGVTLCMHIGSSSTNPAASPDAPKGVGGTLAFNNSMASLADWLFSGKLIQFPKLKLAYSEGQIGWIPYALERADTVWDQHDAWQHSKELIPEPPSTYYYGRIFGCFTADRHGLQSLDQVGVDNICFETDYPHTDTTWPNSHQYIQDMLEGYSDEVAYKVLRGNAIRMLELDRV